MNIDFRYRLIEIDKEKQVVNSINIDDFPIEIDNHFYRFLSIPNDCYRLTTREISRAIHNICYMHYFLN